MKKIYRWPYFWIAVGAGALAGIFSKSIGLGIAIFAAFITPLWWAIYIEYARDNPKGYWFKRKLYGFGWTPVTWQGWVVTGGYVALVLLFALTLDESSSPREVAFTYILPVIILTTLLISIAYKKGERPRWQWGRDPDTEEEQ